MNRLGARRRELNLTQPIVAAELRKIDKRLDVIMLSRFENDACLPTPETMKCLSDTLQAPVFDLYDLHDIDLISLGLRQQEPVNPVSGYAGEKRNETHMKKCFRLLKETAESLPDDLLPVCGFVSWQAWFEDKLKLTLAEYAARVKEKSRPDTPMSRAAGGK